MPAFLPPSSPPRLLEPATEENALNSDSNSDDAVIVIMGPTGGGKTAFINLASNSDLKVGEGLESCTVDVASSLPFQLDGKRVVLVDTPGFDGSARSDTEILRMVSDFLITSYEDGKKVAGVLYFHRISDFRMGGISRRNFQALRELCGDATLRNVIIVTNMWGEVTPEMGDKRENQLKTEEKFFLPAIAAGASVYRHDNTKLSAEIILRHIVGNIPLPLNRIQEIIDERRAPNQTTTGTVLDYELLVKEEMHRKAMEEMRREMEATKWVMDVRMRREKERRGAATKVVETDLLNLGKRYKEERDKWDYQRQEREWNKDLEWKRKVVDREMERQSLQRMMDKAWGRTGVDADRKSVV